MNESGIRLALGATRPHVQMLIIGQTMRILLAASCRVRSYRFSRYGMASHFLYGSVSSNSLAITVAAVVLAFPGVVATPYPLAARHWPTSVNAPK